MKIGEPMLDYVMRSKILENRDLDDQRSQATLKEKAVGKLNFSTAFNL